VGGALLIVIGAYALVAQVVPGSVIWPGADLGWPLIIVGAGVLLLLAGLLVGVPDMAVPAAVVGGIGGVLYWQNVTGKWESWSYIWTLIPGFVGLGIVLAGLHRGDLSHSIRVGARLVVISALMFVVFGAFFGALGLLGDYWPVILIGLGLWLLARRVWGVR
jgi:hypothetical protein